ncbi:hypothetical protein Taro_007133 [Colocasia esculenta]|uniref:C2 domain-containing protein n=1 Tax=Colocasia esculenta TaxID=4460 RepID=A0A843TX93_COLES|nr:hypothetical protein [Colocasia esculenta]
MAAGGSVRKLVVEVVEARDLLPKDGAGSSSPYAVIDFDGQRKRTQTVHRSLNPTWNEVLKFDVSGEPAAGEPLEVDVLHDRRAGTPSRRSNLLGRLRLDPTQFVREGEEALIYFPLQKKNFFSWVRGDIGLKVYYADEPLPPPEEPPVAEAQKPAAADAAPAPAPTETAAADTEKAGEPAAATEPPAAGQATPAETPPAPDQPAPETPSDAADAGNNQEPPPAAAAEAAAGAPAPQEEVSNAENPTVPPAENSTAAPVPAEETPATTEPDTSDPSLSQDPEKDAAFLQPQPRSVTRPPVPVATAVEDGVERSTLDLVDKMQYLFVRVVRARSLPGGAANPRVRIFVSGRTVSTGPAAARRTHHTVKEPRIISEWDQTFAFPRGSAGDAVASDQAPLEVSVWDLPPGSPDDPAAGGGRFLGGVCFDVSEVPTRDPPDSPLAPQWYRLESDDGAVGGDLMLATWVGTQADESFHGAWKADAPCGGGTAGSKVYVSPKLWYLRLTILDCQEVLPLPLAMTAAGSPLINAPMSVRATLGFQSLRTRPASLHRGGSPAPPPWNEDLLFVVAEPLGDQVLHLAVELRPGKEPPAVLAVAGIPLTSVERRVDDRKVAPRWLDLVVPSAGKKAAAAATAPRLRGRLQVRVCLDGGYHVADEPAHACSDYRPSARQLWRSPIGTVELGIIGCRNLLPTKTIAADSDGLLRASADAYAVAKYGPKWARTRTVADSLDPTWNEQYTWPVHDPCTVLTVAVMDESPVALDNDGAGKDAAAPCRPIGRVRIRISALESGRAYRASYPLYLLLPTGLRRTGEVDLAVRFARAGSAFDLLHVYGQPVLPIMHYVRPIAASQRDQLRFAAARTVAAHLARSEPSLRREVVMYLLDAEGPAQTGFSMRKVRANWNRAVSSLTWITDVVRWVDDIRSWRNRTATILAHAVLVLLVWHPDLIVPAVGFHVSLLGLWRYRKRPRGTAGTGHIDLRASQLEVAATAPGVAQLAEELDEEFDPTPSGRGPEVVRARYDRLRGAGARVQSALADLAAQGERLHGMVTWQDPRATWIFVATCLLISAVLLVVPMEAAVSAAAFFWLRHPVFRDRAPPRAVNFFQRLPTLSDRIM